MITDTWDGREVLKAEIEPLLNEIMAICQREGISMFAYFASWADERHHRNGGCAVRVEGRWPKEFTEAIKIIKPRTGT